MYSDAFHISKSTVPDSRKFFCAKSKYECIIRLIVKCKKKKKSIYISSTLIFKTKMIFKDYLKHDSDLFLKVIVPET